VSPARKGGWRSRWALRVGALGYVALLVAVPVGSVFYRAFDHGVATAWDAITTSDGLHALWLTLLVVVIAVPLDTVFGVGVALIVSRHRFPGVWLLDALADIPLAISPVVVGLALILVYGQGGWFGSALAGWGIHVIFSLPGIVMASATVALPYVVREVLPVLEEVGTEQEQAAQTLGGGRLAVFRRITLPSIRSGLVYGVTLTTARVLGEFGAVAIVSGNIEGKTQTLTLFVQDSVDNLDPTAAYAGAVILAIVAFTVLGVLGADAGGRRRSRSWRSASEGSPSGSATLLPSMTSASTSMPAP
jgi:sulfate/thiosulfate transport system permease protein